MDSNRYKYIIIGGGLSGASAIEGIRELDETGSVLLLCKESYLPYNRPPLSKSLWTGKKKIDDIFIHDKAYYDILGVEIKLGTDVVKMQPTLKSVTDSQGVSYTFEKLLLATGGTPSKLALNVQQENELIYFRNIGDYEKLLLKCKNYSSAIIIGGGFIGMELAAALCLNKVKTTLVMSHAWPCNGIFPAYLGNHILALYREKGVTILTEDKPSTLVKVGENWNMNSVHGVSCTANIVIVGIGITPCTDLAEAGGLKTDNGIMVNGNLQTSHPDIYAAGDNASYPSALIGSNARTEHWDNAQSQGRLAGRNMAGALESYTYLPYFFSDLFDFGFEAVGLIDANLETFADWQKENEKGTIYYVKNNKICGIMLVNIWGKIDAARLLIQKGESASSSADVKNKITD